VSDAFAPGVVVVVRDEEWLITQVEETGDGPVISASGLSELVRGQDAVFYPALDAIEVSDPRQARVRADDSPRYRRSRLWLESMLRKTPVPLGDASSSSGRSVRSCHECRHGRFPSSPSEDSWPRRSERLALKGRECQHCG